MSTVEYEIEMTAACNRLRDAIRNRQAEEDVAAKWRAMSNTSAQRRRIQEECKYNASYRK